MTQNVMISVNNLSVSYDQRTILNDLSFDVYEGEVFAILGGSGSGKTTLMNRIIGLEKPDSGEVFIEGDSIVDAFGDERIKILRKIGVMYQSGALFGSMTLLENVRLPLEEFSNLPFEAMNSIAKNKLDLVGLGDFINFMPAQISGGMARRAAIARAMALDPKILFLDEPSSGLDPIISMQIDQLIISLAKTLGVTFVVVSHELPSIYTIAHRIIMLYGGKIVAEGDPRVLRDTAENDYVRRFFRREALNAKVSEDAL